jgi:hypothetical protein
MASKLKSTGLGKKRIWGRSWTMSALPRLAGMADHEH